jgi:raffinose/stachyose/melibiose transport system substrate-binding protein
MKIKAVSLLLCVLLVFSVLAGCTTESGDTQDNEKDKETTKLTLWSIATASDAFNNAYNKAIVDVEKENGITIEHVTTENEAYKQKIKTAVSANAHPDLLYAWGGGFAQPFVESGKILDITKYYTDDIKEQLSEAALTYSTYDGKIYGSTYTTPISLLYYNSKILSDNGVEPPSTFDELVSACEMLKEKGITPMSISAKDKWVIAMLHDNLTMKSVGSEKIRKALLKDGQSYKGPEFLETATNLSKLVELGAFQEGAASMTNDEAKALFLEGKVAMHTMGAWLAGDIQKLENKDDFDAVPFPTTSGNAKLTDFMGGAVDTIMVNSSVKDPDLAGKVVFELTRGISKYSYLDGAGLAVWKKDYDDSSVDPMTKKLAGYVEEATSFTMWFDTFMGADDAAEYLVLLQELFLGNIEPEEFVDSFSAQLEK